MANGDLGEVVVVIEARLDALEQGLADAERKVEQSAERMEQSTSGVGRGFESSADTAAKLALAVAGIRVTLDGIRIALAASEAFTDLMSEDAFEIARGFETMKGAISGLPFIGQPLADIMDMLVAVERRGQIFGQEVELPKVGPFGFLGRFFGRAADAQREVEQEGLKEVLFDLGRGFEQRQRIAENLITAGGEGPYVQQLRLFDFPLENFTTQLDRILRDAVRAKTITQAQSDELRSGLLERARGALGSELEFAQQRFREVDFRNRFATPFGSALFASPTVEPGEEQEKEKENIKDAIDESQAIDDIIGLLQAGANQGFA